jgi:hypothetical protein
MINSVINYVVKYLQARALNLILGMESYEGSTGVGSGLTWRLYYETLWILYLTTP